MNENLDASTLRVVNLSISRQYTLSRGTQNANTNQSDSTSSVQHATQRDENPSTSTVSSQRSLPKTLLKLNHVLQRRYDPAARSYTTEELLRSLGRRWSNDWNEGNVPSTLPSFPTPTLPPLTLPIGYHRTQLRPLRSLPCLEPSGGNHFQHARNGLERSED